MLPERRAPSSSLCYITATYCMLIFCCVCTFVDLLTSEASVNIFLLWKQGTSSCLCAVFFGSVCEPCVPTVFDMDTQWRIPLQFAMIWGMKVFVAPLSCRDLLVASLLYTKFHWQTLVVFTWKVISYRAHSWKGLCGNFSWTVKGTFIVPPNK